MVKEKGKIRTENIEIEQSYNWVRELLEKAKTESLNIKDAEFEAVNEIIDKLEKEYNKYKKFYVFLKPIMSVKQKDDYINILEI